MYENVDSMLKARGAYFKFSITKNTEKLLL